MSHRNRLVFGVLLAAAAWVAPPAAQAQSCVIGEPATPDCAAPRVIPGDVGHHVVYMDASGSGTVVPTCTTGVDMSSVVYFVVTPNASGQITVSTCHPNTSYDTVLRAYSGGTPGSCLNWSEIACIDDVAEPACSNGCSFYGGRVTFYGNALQSYLIEVGAFSENTAGCTLCLGLVVSIGDACGDAPTNIVCGAAKEVSGDPGVRSVVADTTDAILVPGEPIPPCGMGLARTLWYKFTPTVDSFVHIDTCNPTTSFDTILGVYIGDCGGALFEVTCNDDWGSPECQGICDLQGPRQSAVEFVAAAGQEYLVQVGAYSGELGCQPRACVGVDFEITDLCEFDTAPPTAQLTAPADFECVCGVTDLIGTASDADGALSEYRLEYRMVNDAQWNLIYAGTATVQNAELVPGGWSAPFAEGYYVVRLTVVDACGKTSAAERVIRIDSVLDVASIDAPAHASVVAREVCVIGRISNSICGMTYTVDYRPVGAGAFQPVDPSNPVYFTAVTNDIMATWDTIGLALPDGDYELRLAADTGCAGASQTIIVTVDNTAPLAVISSPVACDAVSGTISITGTIYDDNLTSWALYYADGAANAWVQLATGTAPVIDAQLTTWNTVTQDGCATALRLIATDASARTCTSTSTAFGNQSEFVAPISVGLLGCGADLDCSMCVDIADFWLLQQDMGQGANCPN